jgi:N-acetylmuramic acid 6-phosphate etherase
VITEGHDAGLADLDLRSTADVVRALNDANAVVLDALREAEGALVALVDAAAARAGRVVYVGAGSAGQMAAADADEWGPTFSVAEGAVVALVAGASLPPGPLREGAEDDADAGGAELRVLAPTADDVVIGVSASGHTPYTLGALRAARDAGALTAAVVCAPDSPMAVVADHAVVLPVGPEVIAGSTRLKAGTATKITLNAMSTAAFVLLGKTYGGLMVDVRPTNAKLWARAIRIVRTLSGVDDGTARRLIEKAGGRAKVALVMHHAGVNATRAKELLVKHKGSLRAIVGDVAPGDVSDAAPTGDGPRTGNGAR